MLSGAVQWMRPALAIGQVVVVGDLNVAASQRDVHAKLCWENMYGAEEKAELAALLRALPDVWRLRHPDTANAFTARPGHDLGLGLGCLCMLGEKLTTCAPMYRTLPA